MSDTTPTPEQEPAVDAPEQVQVTGPADGDDPAPDGPAGQGDEPEPDAQQE